MNYDAIVKATPHLHWEGSGRLEGEVGVRNLSRFLSIIQSDPYPQLLFQGGQHSTLLEFLADNPGAVEVLMEWVEDHRGDEFADLIEDEDEDEDEDLKE